jgi:hypothetical protein
VASVMSARSRKNLTQATVSSEANATSESGHQ